MSGTNKAVFLSYASQDAEAAKRIADALRVAGVEVWFDQNELVGGDAWDKKIRGQISSCALFVPIISANTNARSEGYFRLEWKLAVDRSHLMADDAPFLFPIVIGDVSDAAARVPEKFRERQWTRLRLDETPAELAGRVTRLLSGNVAGVADPGPGSASPVTGKRGKRDNRPAWLRHAWAVIGLIFVVYYAMGPIWKPWFRDKAPQPVGETTVASLSTARDWPRDPELKRAIKLIFSLDAIAEDYVLAEDILKPVVAARPNDPEVATVTAVVAQEFLTRGFDVSQTRRSQVQKLTERAVQLAPESPEALAALGRYLIFVNSQLPRAENLLKQAIALQPNEPRYYRVLHSVLSILRPGPESEELAERMFTLFPNDALVRYDYARAAKDRNDLVVFERELDASLAIAPVATALMWKSWLATDVHGDTVAAKAWLDRVPERQRSGVRYASTLSTYASISGDTGPAIEVLNDLSDTWLSDFNFTGPKALLLGDLLVVAGRKDLARLQYEAALIEIKREKTRDPTDLRVRRAEFWTLLGLGLRDEAHAVLRILLDGSARPYRVTMNNNWWSGPVRASLLMGERGPALALIREAVVDSQSRLLLKNSFKLDPRMAPFRDDAEINALLAEPEKGK